MAEVNTGDGGGGKHGKKRAKKSSTRIDMTPMVDLAFLLLTFFVLTSTFSKPKTLEINFPAKPKPEDKPQKVNNAVTFILSKDKVFYYTGQYYPATNPEGKPATEIKESNFGPQGVRKLIADLNTYVNQGKEKLDLELKNKALADTTYKNKLVDIKGNKLALTALIKTDDKATYANVIDLVDELNIGNVGKYAIVDIEKGELDLLLAKNP